MKYKIILLDKKMKTLSKIVVLVMGCSLTSLTHQSFGSEDAPQNIISVDDSELGNWDKPITLDFKHLKNYGQVDYLLQEYIRKNYEGYEIEGRIFTTSEGRFILILSLKNDEDKKATVYFDMTDAYKKLNKSKDKETRKKIKELEEKHKPIGTSSSTK